MSSVGREKDDSTPLRPSLVGSELVQIKLFGSKGLGLLVEQVKDIFLKKVHQKADVKSSNNFLMKHPSQVICLNRYSAVMRNSKDKKLYRMQMVHY